MNYHVPTPTEAAAIERRRKFHRAIERRAAALAASKIVRPVRRLGPESMPAEAAPPRIGLPDWYFMGDQREITPSGTPRISFIQAVVAKYFGVTVNDLCSARRTADIVIPRQIGMYLCRELTLRSLPEIGRRFGKRDHTTALFGINKITRLIPSDAALAGDVSALMGIIAERTA